MSLHEFEERLVDAVLDAWEDESEVAGLMLFIGLFIRVRDMGHNEATMRWLLECPEHNIEALVLINGR